MGRGAAMDTAVASTGTMTGGRWGAGPAYGPMLREDRVAVFGVECAQALEWRNWKPGREYERTLVMKNVGTKSLRIKYQLPQSKYFSMEFPEPVKISAGMSWPVKVIFRPTKLESYEDELTFLLPNGSFTLPLIGHAPLIGIQVPPEMGFGYIAVRQTCTRSFSVQNTGDLATPVQWQVQEPFRVSPARGTIPQGGSMDFDLTFSPTEASVYSAQAVCLVEDGDSGVMSISGIGKFPHLSLDQKLVAFGEVNTGRTSVKHVTLTNPSLVPAHFKVECIECTAAKPACKLSPNSGCIPPSGHITIGITYAPVSTGTHTVDTFEIRTPGGNKTQLSASGHALSTVVSLSTGSLNFGSVEVGGRSVRSVALTNESEVPARYEFVTDALGVFAFGDAVRGDIPPLFTINVNIAFTPKAPCHHWKRVTCLVRNGDPVQLDLLATAFNDRLRPPPLSATHIEEYLDRVAAGGSPLQLEGADSRPASRWSAMSAEAERRALPPPWEAFFVGHDPSAPLALEPGALDFGACSRLRPADHKALSVQNCTRGKLTVYAAAPDWQDPLAPHGEPQPSVFQVFPECADVGPGESVTFRVAFRPPRDGQYYSGTLDFIAHVKHMKSFRLVSDANFNAPFHAAAALSGHTFLHAPEELGPKFSLGASAVHFPPVRIGQAAHATLELINTGDTAVSYDFQIRAVADVFSVSPPSGRVPPQTTLLVGLRFTPHGPGDVHRTLQCAVNNNLKMGLPLTLHGAAYAPALLFEDLPPGGSLFFKPTCVGASTRRHLTLRNPAAVPTAYQWSVPASLSRVLAVEPSSGLLPGKSTAELTFRFAPIKTKAYTGQLTCMIRPGGMPPSPDGDDVLFIDLSSFDSALSLGVVGEGAAGAVSLDPPSLDCGVLLAGHAATFEMTLLNHSAGVLAYRAEIVEEGAEVETHGGGPTPVPPTPPPGSAGGLSVLPAFGQGVAEVSMSEPEGLLYARTSKTVKVTIHPQSRKSYRYQLMLYTAVVEEEGEGGVQGSERAMVVPGGGRPTAVASIHADSTFPLLQVTDAAVLPPLPKPLLWRTLGLQPLNLELGEPLNEAELGILDAVARGADMPTVAVLAALQPLAMEFGMDALGAEPVEVHLELTNAGSALPVAWAITLQDAPDVEVENWVEPAVPHDDEACKLAFMLEHNIFSISPMRGELPPGSSCRLSITYKHISPGLHDLPLLLTVAEGKSVRLHLQGATVSPAVQALLKTAEHHTLLPMPIGDPEPPTQVQVLHNGGPSTLEYELDTSPLAALTAEHHGVEVLRLESPTSGVVPPRSTTLLKWVLAPVEAREVVVDLPISFSNGKSDVLSIMGRGYHPSLPPGEAEELPGEASLDMASWASFSPAPSLVQPGALAQLSHDVLSMGTVPLHGRSRRVVTVANVWDLPIAFEWDLSHLAPSGGVLMGELGVSPATGTLRPGERALCRFQYTAGVRAEVWEGQAMCRIAATEEAVELSATMTATGAPLLASKTGEGRAEGGGEEEEVIAVHPALPTGKQQRLRAPGSQRLPLHLATTATVRQQRPELGAVTMETLSSMQAAVDAATAPRAVPPPQHLVLHIHGRALTDRQLETGVGCVGSEVAAAAEAYSSSGWREPTVQSLVEAVKGGGGRGAAGQRAEPWGTVDPPMAAAMSVLTDTIMDAIASPELAQAVRELEEATVPRFAQVSDVAGDTIKAAASVEPSSPVPRQPLPPLPHIPTPKVDAAQPPPSIEKKPPERDETIEEGVETRQVDEEGVGEAAGEKGGAVDGCEDKGVAPAVRAALKRPEVQVFTEFVLENALFGLLQESVFDEWNAG